MPYMVNGQPIPEDLVREEERRLGRDPRWTPIPDQATNAAHLRAAAEYSVIARTLVEQAAASDPRPVDPDLIERGVRRAKTDRKSTRLNSSHLGSSYAVFCLKKK